MAKGHPRDVHVFARKIITDYKTAVEAGVPPVNPHDRWLHPIGVGGSLSAGDRLTLSSIPGEMEALQADPNAAIYLLREEDARKVNRWKDGKYQW